MYNTSNGIRVLRGAERRLIVRSLAMIADQVTDLEFETGISVFDDLTRNQKIAAYHAVARALLAEDEPPPALTAVLEAAVASLYDHVGDMISSELIDDDLESDGSQLPRAARWRKMTIAAARQLEIEDVPDLDEQDWDEWDLLIRYVQDRLVWDRDWEMVEHLDAAPEAARRAKLELGIADDYFVAMPSDPSDAEAERLLAELAALTADSHPAPRDDREQEPDGY